MFCRHEGFKFSGRHKRAIPQPHPRVYPYYIPLLHPSVFRQTGLSNLCRPRPDSPLIQQTAKITGSNLRKHSLASARQTYNKICAPSESWLIASAFYSLLAIQRGIKENLVWMYRLIWVFPGHRSYCKFCWAPTLMFLLSHEPLHGPKKLCVSETVRIKCEGSQFKPLNRFTVNGSKVVVQFQFFFVSFILLIEGVILYTVEFQ